MKYTDRKKTPLKWHRILTIIILPVLILSRLYITLSLTNELMGFNIPYMSHYLELLLSAAGIVMHNLGSWFWPVFGLYIAEIALLVWLICIWIWLLKWRKKGRIGWLLYITAELAASCLITWLLYEQLVVREYYILLMPLLISIHLVPALLGSHLSLFIASLAAVSLLWLLFLIFNIIYYHRRRLLFGHKHVQPEQAEKKEEPASEDTDVPETQPADEKKEEISEETDTSQAEGNKQVQENQGDTEDQAVSDVPDSSPAETQSLSVSEPDSTENTVPSEEKTDVSPQEPEGDDSEEMLYCPNCGARLTKYDQNFCTHCGTRLRDHTDKE